MKIQIIIDDELLKLIDTRCQELYCDRSEFVRNCIRSEILASSPMAQPVGVFKVTESADIKPLKIKPMPKKVDHKIAKLKQTLSSIEGMCKHGSAFGNCKFGCK